MARPGEHTASPHKPLPSVDVVLLSRDLRALRLRHAAIGIAVGGLALAAVAGAFGRDLWAAWGAWEARAAAPLADARWPSEGGVRTAAVAVAPTTTPASDPEPTAAQSAPTPMPDARAAPSPAPTATMTEDGRQAVRFGAAGTFREALRAAGCSPDETAQLVDALEGIVDFRRCRPDHELLFDRNPDGTLESFEYRVGPIESFVARRDDADGFRAERVVVPIERRRIARGGMVSGSLAHTLAGVDLGRNLAGAFVEAFEGKIDFAKGMRPGDTFRIVVDEEYIDGEFFRYGTVHALDYAGARSGRLRAFWFQPTDRRGDFHDAKGRAIHGGWLRTPLRYDRLTSGFNLKRMHPILKRIVPHLGIDYAAAPGAQVWAAADGTVTFAGERGANGNLVVIQHASGYETFYAHLSRIARGVKPGVTVSQRDPIGAVGSTGRSTGPHLHFALKRHGRFVDPKRELNGPGRPLPATSMARFRQLVARSERELDAIPLAPAPAVAAGPDAPEPAEDEVFHEDALDL
jgi:murein DD-endopeptidase MepM/ murein hydrolase activator NlpD